MVDSIAACNWEIIELTLSLKVFVKDTSSFLFTKYSPDAFSNSLIISEYVVFSVMIALVCTVSSIIWTAVGDTDSDVRAVETDLAE